MNSKCCRDRYVSRHDVPYYGAALYENPRQIGKGAAVSAVFKATQTELSGGTTPIVLIGFLPAQDAEIREKPLGQGSMHMAGDSP